MVTPLSFSGECHTGGYIAAYNLSLIFTSKDSPAKPHHDQEACLGQKRYKILRERTSYIHPVTIN